MAKKDKKDKKVKVPKRKTLNSWLDRIRKAEKKERDATEEIKRCEKDLRHAIFREEFEEASILRDRIKELNNIKKK